MVTMQHLIHSDQHNSYRTKISHLVSSTPSTMRLGGFIAVNMIGGDGIIRLGDNHVYYTIRKKYKSMSLKLIIAFLRVRDVI